MEELLGGVTCCTLDMIAGKTNFENAAVQVKWAWAA
jgi:hypothetical protein